MNRKRTSLLLTLLLTAAVLAACSSPSATPATATSPSETAEEASIEEPSATVTPEADDSGNTAPEDEFFATAEAKTTLLVYAGDVRVSHDDGESWNLADTGLWLESGDRLQISPGGLALILFPDSSLIRLEGFTDFELVQSEFDFEAGTKWVIGRVLDGAALVTTVPLPNPESLFQLWLMTTLIDLPYNPDHALPLDQAETIPDEDRIVFGASMREELEGEVLFSYAGSVLPDYYALEIVDEDLVMIKTTPPTGQLTQFELPFRDNIEDEFELEGMLDMAAGLLAESRTGQDASELDFYGYSFIEEGALSETQTLYTIFPVEEREEFLEEASDQAEQAAFINIARSSPAYKRYKLWYRYYKRIPDIFAPEILLMIEKYNLGCDIKSGLGCAIPDGCDQDSGEGCTFTSGCNIITREGCSRARLSCIAYTNCDLMPCGRRPTIRHFCKPRIRTYCDPAVAGDCDQYLLSSVEQLAALAEQMGPSVDAAGAETEGAAAQTQTTGTSGGEDAAPLEELPPTLPLELAQNSELAGQPLYDPNDPVSVEPFYSGDYWNQLIQYYKDLYGDYGGEDGGDENIEWCTCTASHAGYPDPPPWMDMTYRCWCSDPGAK